ncbi:MAG: hypothetical protein QOH32_1923 [Bradyrhizobium sp.]|nr:hypothetical protein [Bradyrhizobium sp.]
MSVLFSGLDNDLPPLDEEAYPSWLISRNQSPIADDSGKLQLKRLRVVARKLGNRIAAALVTIHQAIVAAKLRRVQRELQLHARDLRDIPQQPLILGDKWDY